MLIVIADPVAPASVRCVELVMTTYQNGDWEIEGPTPELTARGGQDSSERSLSRFLLGLAAYAPR